MKRLLTILVLIFPLGLAACDDAGTGGEAGGGAPAGGGEAGGTGGGGETGDTGGGTTGQ